jgi:hypothetical protein
MKEEEKIEIRFSDNIMITITILILMQIESKDWLMQQWHEWKGRDCLQTIWDMIARSAILFNFDWYYC